MTILSIRSLLVSAAGAVRRGRRTSLPANVGCDSSAVCDRPHICCDLKGRRFLFVSAGGVRNRSRETIETEIDRFAQANLMSRARVCLLYGHDSSLRSISSVLAVVRHHRIGAATPTSAAGNRPTCHRADRQRRADAVDECFMRRPRSSARNARRPARRCPRPASAAARHRRRRRRWRGCGRGRRSAWPRRASHRW